jgi:hypothetical protein
MAGSKFYLSILAASGEAMPWQMWAYFGIGIVVAYWYQKREELTAADQGLRTQRYLILILACFWPIILFAALANPPAKPKKPVEQSPDKKGDSPGTKESGRGGEH